MSALINGGESPVKYARRVALMANAKNAAYTVGYASTRFTVEHFGSEVMIYDNRSGMHYRAADLLEGVKSGTAI